MIKTVMLFGIGAVGGQALLILAHSEGIDRIALSGRDEELGVFKMNAAALGSVDQGITRKYEFFKNDAQDIDTTARLLKKVKPDVILLSLSVHPPGFIGMLPLPREVRERFQEAGFGAQLPWHLLLPAKFMQAIKKSGIQTHVINASFPDVVNPALWNHFGFGPTVGIGNIDLLAARIIKHVSDTEDVQVRDVVLSFIGSHALMAHGSQAGVPFFLKIYLGDRDITEKYDVNWLTRKHPRSEHLQREGETISPYSNHITAASAVKNILAIANDTNQYTLASSPNGLIGGYPVRLNARGAKTILPKEFTLEQAIKINEDAERFDGIEKIKADGTIIYTDKTYSAMKELGYDCKELTFDDIESRCKELEMLTNKLYN